MTIETLVKNVKEGDKDVIIQSLIELITLLAEGQKMQEEVIPFLPEACLARIFEHLEDPDIQIRKLTAKFLLDLVFENYLVQLVFCDILGIIPSDGKICLNNLPDAFKSIPKHIPECFEALKKKSPLEKKDQLPYCWYLHVRDADKSENKITFVQNEGREALNQAEDLFDPLFCLFGFIMKSPKKIQAEKAPVARGYHHTIKPSSSPHIKPDLKLNLSLDQSLAQRAMIESKAQNTSNKASKETSVKRKPIVKNPLANSQQVTSSRTYKPKMNTSLLTPTSDLSKSEKMNNKTAILVTEGLDDGAFGTLDKTNDMENSYRKKLTDRKVAVRKTEPAIEPYECFNDSKLNASINEISETNSKTLENSLNSSTNMKDSAKIKPKPIKSIKAVATTNGKTQTHREKNSASVLTSEEINLSQQGKQKSGEPDKNLPSKTPKSRQSMQINGNKALPNTSLLNKILKAKPLSKDKASTQNSEKQDDSKASFWDFIYAYRKLNATTLSSVMTSSNRVAKTPNSSKKKDEAPRTADDPSIKRRMHTSVAQPYETNNSVREKYEAIDDELSLDLTTKEEGENNNTTDNTTTTKSNVALRNYHISTGFKNPIASSRASQEIKKESLTTFGKLMSPRKSHDVTYLSNYKRKSDISGFGLENKSKKGTRANITLTSDSPKLK